MLQEKLILGTITKTKLLEEVASTITRYHSSIAAQLFNKVLQFRKFVYPIDGPGELFEKWERIDKYEHLYRRQISDDIFLFKDLHNRYNEDYPFNFHEVKPTTIDISKFEKWTINKILDGYGAYVKPEQRDNRELIATVLYREIVPRAEDVIQLFNYQ